MWDFSVGKTLAIMMRTMPFILFRMAVFFGIALAYIVSTGACGGFGWLLGRLFSTDPGGWGVWGGIFGFGFVSAALYWLREWILWHVQAGHIAVMVEALAGRELPNGQGQIAYAATVVKDRFGESNVLFLVDQLVKGVIAVITGLVSFLGSFVPMQQVQGLINFVNAVISYSLRFLAPVVLAHNIAIRSENPWETSRHAVVLYAQNYWTFLKNALWLVLFSYALTILIFVVMIVPIGAIAAFFPGDLAIWGVILALVFAISFKAAILDPFAICAMIQVFQKATAGQTPDPAWDAKLASASAKFRQLGEKAVAWVRGGPSAPAAPTALASDGRAAM